MSLTSVSVKLTPRDRRCRYWAVVVRAACALPLPSAVDGASDIGVGYSRPGDEELLVGDVAIEGEANHHVKNRGWSYWVSFVGADGQRVCVRDPGTGVKAALKAAGMRPELLPGSGQVAACVRLAHAVRDGVVITRADADAPLIVAGVSVS